MTIDLAAAAKEQKTLMPGLYSSLRDDLKKYNNNSKKPSSFAKFLLKIGVTNKALKTQRTALATSLLQALTPYQYLSNQTPNQIQRIGSEKLRDECASIRVQLNDFKSQNNALTSTYSKQTRFPVGPGGLNGVLERYISQVEATIAVFDQYLNSQSTGKAARTFFRGVVDDFTVSRKRSASGKQPS